MTVLWDVIKRHRLENFGCIQKLFYNHVYSEYLWILTLIVVHLHVLDDTYMYDEDVRYGGLREVSTGGQHWYDEPPYESDPDDFLMGVCGESVPAAKIQNGRYVYQWNPRTYYHSEA